MITKTRIKSGEYHDSVTLLGVAQALTQAEGIADAAVVMGTPANKELLNTAGLLTEQARDASPNDLIIVVKGESEDHTISAMQLADGLLSAKHTHSDGSSAQPTPRFLAAAVERMDDSNIVLISVAGRYAASVAFDALLNNQHVFLFCFKLFFYY